LLHYFDTEFESHLRNQEDRGFRCCFLQTLSQKNQFSASTYTTFQIVLLKLQIIIIINKKHQIYNHV
jgi:hypothetical protein